jgi:hypothetical protein
MTGLGGKADIPGSGPGRQCLTDGVEKGVVIIGES